MKHFETTLTAGGIYQEKLFEISKTPYGIAIWMVLKILESRRRSKEMNVSEERSRMDTERG